MTGPGIYSYSTTPASNVNANTGINWDEGMAPAAVNNSARQNMTDLRNAFNDLVWFRYGKGDLDYSPVYVASTQFKIAGADVTTAYHVGRGVKIVGSSTGTIYGKISVSSFSTDTTVTCVYDSGSLSNETLTVYLSQVPVTGKPVHVDAVRDIVSSTYTPTITSVVNVAATTAYASQYIRIGSVVTVSGKVDIDPTSGSIATEIGISLPIASNFSASEQASGTAVQGGQAGLCASVNADPTNDRVSLFFVNTADTDNRSWTYQFTYRII